jgi:hypothetical protein
MELRDGKKYRLGRNKRSRSKRKINQPIWDEQLEGEIQTAFSVQRKRNSNLWWGAILGGLACVAGFAALVSPTFLNRFIDLQQSTEDDVGSTAFYVFLVSVVLSFLSCVKGLQPYDENVKITLRDRQNEQLIGLKRFEGIQVFSGSKKSKKRNLAAQQRFARSNGNSNINTNNSGGRTPNNMRSTSYNNRMRMNNSGGIGTPGAEGLNARGGNVFTDRFANGSWSADVVLGKRAAQRRMLQRGDYYKNGEEQFDMENLNGKLDFDMIDPKLDIRDTKTLNKFESAMRRTNVQNYSRNSGGAYRSGPSNTRRVIASYVGMNRPNKQEFRPYEISEKVGQLIKSGEGGDNFLQFNESYALAEEEYKRLGIDDKIDSWVENIKKWLPKIAMKHFLEPFEWNSNYLVRMFNYDMDLLEHRKKVQRNYAAADGGASRFRRQSKNADNMTFEKMMGKLHQTPSGKNGMQHKQLLWHRHLMQSFLQVNGNTNESSCGYVLHRIRELCLDGHYGNMVWDGGSKWKNKLWSNHRSPPLPCDAHIIMHLFFEYMNSVNLPLSLYELMDLELRNPDKRKKVTIAQAEFTDMPNTFSNARFLNQDDDMDDGRGYHDLYIRLMNHEPPYYAVFRNGKQVPIRPRHENVYDAIAVFLFFVLHDFDGSINSVSVVEDMQGDTIDFRSFLQDDLLVANVGNSFW